MDKIYFKKFIKANLNILSSDKKYLGKLMIIDRGRSRSILQSALLARLVVKKFKLNPILFTTNKKNSWQTQMYSAL